MTFRSEGEAEELILRILPEDIRQKCLMIFADAIAEANVYGRNKWAVRNQTNPDRIQLLVNHIVVCTLGRGHIWMALDQELLEMSNHRFLLDRSDDWEWGTDGLNAGYTQISTRNGCYTPSDKHEELWPAVRRLHFESIYRAADETSMDRRSRKSHSPAILRYLRNELRRHVPDPLY